MMEPAEDRLRDLFEELRRKDEHAAPSFPAMVSGKPDRRRLRRADSHARLLGLGAAAALLLVCVVLFLPRPARVPVATRSASRLEQASWRAPTDFLLAVPVSELVKSAPALDSSVLGSPPPSPPKEKKGRPS